MFQNYDQVEEYLSAKIPNSNTEKFPGQFGIERMRFFLEKLGSPQLRYPTIHIAGTSGKGSTAYLTTKILAATGRKIGLHTSPHLQTVRERFRINDKMISEQDYVELINNLVPTIEAMENYKHGQPSYFEILVAAVFVYFDQQKVDAAVIEAGLGGKFDGTNVLDATITILTNVGLDHTHILGKTKSLILRDKMQIIKEGNTATIAGVSQPNLIKELAEHCQNNQVPLLRLDKNFSVKNIIQKNQLTEFDYVSNDFGEIKKINLSASGVFQTRNAALAITACLSFARAHGFNIEEETIKKALVDSHFAGRFEVVDTDSTDSQVILDGAHNPDKIKALVESLEFFYPGEKFTLVFGLKKNKSAAVILKILAPYIETAIITQFSRSTDMGLNLFYPAEKLIKEAKKFLSCTCYLEPDPEKAFKRAQEISLKNENNVLVTGSLYLVGEIRDHLRLETQ
jgi:dihydrofolate synthase/folylpolyglutamate synthase